MVRAHCSPVRRSPDGWTESATAGSSAFGLAKPHYGVPENERLMNNSRILANEQLTDTIRQDECQEQVYAEFVSSPVLLLRMS